VDGQHTNNLNGNWYLECCDNLKDTDKEKKKKKKHTIHASGSVSSYTYTTPFKSMLPAPLILLCHTPLGTTPSARLVLLFLFSFSFSLSVSFKSSHHSKYQFPFKLFVC